jgi:MarR family transcriptional regulator for hemolysin
MVAMIDRLVKAGMVIREASTTDRRVKRIILTAAGMKIYAEVKTEAAALRKGLLANTNPKQLLIATELLEGLQGMIDTQEPV